LPGRLHKAVEEAVSLYLFFEKKSDVNFAPVFTALLGVIDETAKGLVMQKLQSRLPPAAPDQQEWFEPYLAKVDSRMHRHYTELARNLRKTLVYQSGVSPLGLLRNCYDYALNDSTALTGVFEAVKEEFRSPGARLIFDSIQWTNEFRNTRVAHQEKALTDREGAKRALLKWVEALALIWQENADEIYSRKCVVETVSILPKEKAEAKFIAEIRVVLPEINAGPAGNLPNAFAQSLRRELAHLIQLLADVRFGAKEIRIDCRDFRSGSLEFTVVLSVIAGGAYKFTKDYDKLRANAALLASDIRRACCRLRRTVLKLLSEPENPFGN
jgi:hypothetical protein